MSCGWHKQEKEIVSVYSKAGGDTKQTIDICLSCTKKKCNGWCEKIQECKRREDYDDVLSRHLKKHKINQRAVSLSLGRSPCYMHQVKTWDRFYERKAHLIYKALLEFGYSETEDVFFRVLRKAIRDYQNKRDGDFLGIPHG